MKKIAYVSALGILALLTTEFGIIGGNLFIGRYMAVNLHRTAIISLCGNILIAAGFWWSLPYNIVADMIVLIALGILYEPTFIIGSALATEAAPEAVEFPNSVAASVTNLEITLGTVVGSWIIQNYDAWDLQAAGAAIGIFAIIFVSIFYERSQEK